MVLHSPKDPEDPCFAEARALNSGFSRPTHHVTKGSRGPARKVAPRDTIWILSQIRSPWGTLPVGLDARIDVKRIDVCSRSGTRRFIAASLSAWFPLADVNDRLKGLPRRLPERRELIDDPALNRYIMKKIF